MSLEDIAIKKRGGDSGKLDKKSRQQQITFLCIQLGMAVFRNMQASLLICPLHY
jgi:hypothetical protein